MSEYELWLEKYKKGILEYVKDEMRADKKRRKTTSISVEFIRWWSRWWLDILHPLDHKEADILVATNYISKMLEENGIENEIDYKYYNIELK